MWQTFNLTGRYSKVLIYLNVKLLYITSDRLMSVIQNSKRFAQIFIREIITYEFCPNVMLTLTIMHIITDYHPISTAYGT